MMSLRRSGSFRSSISVRAVAPGHLRCITASPIRSRAEVSAISSEASGHTGDYSLSTENPDSALPGVSSNDGADFPANWHGG